jgi:putative hydrolase of the HAD superfamily
MSLPFDAVVLDAGNTLVFADPDRITSVLHRHGASGDASRFSTVERTARLRLSRRTDEGATGTEEQFWRDYFATLYEGMDLPPDAWGAVTADLQSMHARDHLWTHVGPGTLPALEAILDAGYRLAVVSNADGRVEALLERVGLASYFEFVVDSEVVGVAKPDPRIFGIALGRLGTPPRRTLYVGDLYAVDVRGARAAGMEALLLDPFDQLGHWTDVRRIPDVACLPDMLETW